MKKQEWYWTYRSAYQTPELADLPPGSVRMTSDEWESLSPGMRRDIYRSFTGQYPPLNKAAEQPKPAKPESDSGLTDLFEENC